MVRPGNQAEVEALIAFAVQHHIALVPFGGGTSVTGGLAVDREGFAGVVSVDRSGDTAAGCPGTGGPVEAEGIGY